MSFYVTYPSTAVSSGPVQFYLNGAPTYVSEDTGTPANSIPLPVTILGGSGVPADFNDNYGASSGAIRTASQIGSATGAADFNAGATGAQTLRVVANQGAANATPWNVAPASLPLPTGAATEATLSAFSAKSAGALVPVAFDYIAITYVGATTNINTAVYKLGGSGGATVATLTMGYDGSSRLTSVTKT